MMMIDNQFIVKGGERKHVTFEIRFSAMGRRAIVVLGCKAPNDQPTPMMTRRVELAAKVYADLARDGGEAPFLIPTGYAGHGQTHSEAALMRRIAVEANVPSDYIQIEERATCTVENAYFSKLLIDEANVDEIHVVTSDFHVRRVEIIFETFFHSPAYALVFHGAPETLTAARKASEDRETSLVHRSLDYFVDLHGSDADPRLFRSSLIPDDLFAHAFTCRIGGVSRYETLSSLNLHFNANRKDPRLFVRRNQARLAKCLRFDAEKFEKAACVHGNAIWVVGGDDPRPTDGYDGLVTDRKGVVLAAPGADCMPVLLCDPVKKVCGACHSGWRGTLAKVVLCALQTMKERFGCCFADVRVAVGPSIGTCCFEVGEDVAAKFDSRFVVRRSDWKKPHVDLWGYLYTDLASFGILPENMDVPKPWKEGRKSIDRETAVTQCTVCDPEDRFFSYRRHGMQYGTQCGVIGMLESSS